MGIQINTSLGADEIQLGKGRGLCWMWNVENTDADRVSIVFCFCLFFRVLTKQFRRVSSRFVAVACLWKFYWNGNGSGARMINRRRRRRRRRRRGRVSKATAPAPNERDGRLRLPGGRTWRASAWRAKWRAKRRVVVVGNQVIDRCRCRPASLEWIGWLAILWNHEKKTQKNRQIKYGSQLSLIGSCWPSRWGQVGPRQSALDNSATAPSLELHARNNNDTRTHTHTHTGPFLIGRPPRVGQSAALVFPRAQLTTFDSPPWQHSEDREHPAKPSKTR